MPSLWTSAPIPNGEASRTPAWRRSCGTRRHPQEVGAGRALHRDLTVRGDRRGRRHPAADRLQRRRSPPDRRRRRRASSTTSKAAIVQTSAEPGIDVEYTFAQVGIGDERVEWASNCSNCATAFALCTAHNNLVPITANS
ncbi:PrpF domain-containing protein [Streptomyces sp. NPDC056987]|uniref:PrpF domain-containing protein n=1 Tax=Streptomyces sp. NPDC056987 TaxID=3345988 RepID=UPI0036389B65